jgi:hypothetical protein
MRDDVLHDKTLPPEPRGLMDFPLHRRQLLLALVAMSAAGAASSQDAERRVPVSFAEGTARSFEDSISDFQVVTYVVPLRKGQTLAVLLASNNASNCFDIHVPDVAKPVYVGSESGSSHQFQALVAGEHLVKVFLLRLAARDGQTAHYTLELKLAG